MNRIGRADGGEARGGSSGAEAVVQHPAGRWRHDGRYDGDDNEERCFWRPTWWEMEEPPLERTTWRLSFDFYTDDSFVNRSCRSDCNCGSISSPLSIIQLLFNKICLSLSLSLSLSLLFLWSRLFRCPRHLLSVSNHLRESSRIRGLTSRFRSNFQQLERVCLMGDSDNPLFFLN